MFNNTPPLSNANKNSSNDKKTIVDQTKDERLKRLLELKSKSDKISRSLKIRGDKEVKKQNLIFNNGKYNVIPHLTDCILIQLF